MTMRSRPYLHYAPVPGGVYFSGPHTQFVILGPKVLLTVADVCVPLLETGTTQDELVAALGSERARPAVRRLTDELRARGLLLDPERFTVAAPDAETRERFGEALSHLEAFSDDPYAAFAALRAARVLLYGPCAAVLPAARGLARAGAGKLLLAPTDPRDAVATARRLGATLLTDGVDGPDAVNGGAGVHGADGVDAVIWCAEATGVAEAATRLLGLPDDVPLVPVRLGTTVLVGPVVTGRSGPDTADALAARAEDWAAAQETGPAPRPGADALAGALAGQLVFEALTGVGMAGGAHIVHGEDLSADVLRTAAPEPTAVPEPATAPAAGGNVPAADPVLQSVVAPLSTPWTGLFDLTEGGDLPQLPLALREARLPGRAGTGVIGWAGDQQGATVAVALEALRRLSDPDGTPAVGAAGTTEEQWLLDGALRLLTEHAVPSERPAPDPLPPGTQVVQRALAEEHGLPVTVRLLEVPGVSWPLAQAVHADTGEPYGHGWGPTVDEAVHGCLGTVLARGIAARLRPGADVTAVHTGALRTTGQDASARLRAEIAACAAAGVLPGEPAGTPLRSDPVLGTLPVFFGPVSLSPAQGPAAPGPVHPASPEAVAHAEEPAHAR
ncbi:hypothetical protein [Streptomyces brevispora]|uniref:Thiazole-containing bacteriocin maturation protein n=1 Tax=Streptomyces brevispora TaxID=887462 RepID=A0ABZ1FYR0_9ACTN|nr:hypothetical protein [Streptomyces brevispora]WSC12761.1 hypothetical protein OIE64_07865 [Streptomyces brevispora]